MLLLLRGAGFPVTGPRSPGDDQTGGRCSGAGVVWPDNVMQTGPVIISFINGLVFYLKLHFSDRFRCVLNYSDIRFSCKVLVFNLNLTKPN